MGASKKGQAPAGDTTTTTTSQPWSQQIPYLEQAFQGAQNLYEGAGPQYYPGSTFSAPTDAQNTALSSIEGTASQPNSVANGATDFTTNLLGGDYLNSNPASQVLGNGTNLAGTSALTPYANGSMLSSANPGMQAMEQSVASSVIPSISAAFANGNSGNNPALAYAASQGVTAGLQPDAFENYLTGEQLQNQAGATLGSNQLNAENQVGQNYNSGITAMNQGTAFAPSTAQLPFTNADEEYNAGATEQAQQQGQLNSNVQAYNYGQTEPYQQLATYLGDISGNYGGTSATSSPYFENSTGNALAGGLGGAKLGSSLGPTLGLTSGKGAGLGSIIGALSLFSDRRLKTDIRRIGKASDGLPIYAYKYIGEPTTHVGFMADEVEKVHPEAVYMHPSGFKMVDYAQATA